MNCRSQGAAAILPHSHCLEYQQRHKGQNMGTTLEEGVSKQTGWFDLQIRIVICLEKQNKWRFILETKKEGKF